MDENKSCITINCGCCSKGGGDLITDLDILFEGHADKANETYELLKPITDYRFLVIEYGNSDTGEYWTKLISWIVYPQSSNNPYEYNCLLGVDGPTKETSAILWHFPTPTSLYIDHLWSFSWTVGTRISKVYGIK